MATVKHEALDSEDSHPVDDVCPRQVTPPGVKWIRCRASKFLDKGCEEKKADKTFEYPVLIDVVVKP
jgi:hypothetical protein